MRSMKSSLLHENDSFVSICNIKVALTQFCLILLILILNCLQIYLFD